MSAMQKDLIRELSAYGVEPKECLSLEKISHGTINYLDLQQETDTAGLNAFASPGGAKRASQ